MDTISGIGSGAVVGTKGVALVGVSGHQLAFLPSGTAVSVHEELGSYTRISYEGRSGFVLTDHLERQDRTYGRPSMAHDMPQDETREPTSPLPQGIRWVAQAWPSVLFCLAAIGGTASALFTLR